MLQRSWLLLLPLAGLAAGCRNLDFTVRAETPSPQEAPARQARRPLKLVDVTAASGVRFRHETGAFGRKWFPETNGSGAAIFDYDGDGHSDLFLVNSRDWSPAERKAARLSPGSPAPPTPSRLYRNRGDGTFIDVTSIAGVDVAMYGMGCAVGDYDNDGWTDLYVSGIGRGWLFRNEGGRRFREVARPAGVQGDGWGASCAWVDFNRDGLLDLFVCHYVKWDGRADSPCSGAKGAEVYCGPNLYRPEPCRLYQNKGDGSFADVSKRAGIWGGGGQRLISKALGVAVCDVDNDGWPDLAVANDTEANFLFRNNHDGTFTEQGLASGMALPETGQARSGMGIDAADWDGSGKESLLIGNFWEEMLSLYRPDGQGIFADQAPAVGAGEPSRTATTFGCLFVDLDSDGWLDIATANGHIDERTDAEISIPLRQRPLFLLNQHGKRFREARLHDQKLIGRGLAAGDWNHDGAIDLLLTTNGGPPVLLENGGGTGHALRLVLEGTRSNRSAIGAEVVARAGGRVLRRRVRSGSSYLSASELPVTFGLGDQQQVERLTIRWPSGATEELTGLQAGKEYRIREKSGVVQTNPLSAPPPATLAR